ncbi:hypothetical protein ACI01nite_20580 [Acetobacter cibinongensis]|uniref:DUF945 domain-containing protein n=1 Tax=Acetobacter cibinongensis TaxID=146475 RepID=A0A0D6N1S1_9PROT|nr:hypothetical protein [Acetobacter cibinongensis]GAN59471.1 hypothetical protein Abci_005_065 [Acetobacter cibinongensis]GBQ12481.1 hypothetical protein AA0482_0266 [Acetobacter cibinongensis NRIC 0482]GEL59456.1 hypothetical protein ACI01nite_20580 [Acetobacter cibinongensis]
MKKNVLITVGGLAALACLGWFGARHAEHAMLDKSIESFRQSLGSDTSLTYQKAWPGMLGRSVKFEGLVLRQGPETLTADEAEISKPSTSGDDSRRIGTLSFHNFQLADPAGSLRLDSLLMEGVTLPAKADDQQGIPAQGLEIKHATASQLHGFISSLQSDISATSVSVEDYGGNSPSKLDAQAVALSTDVAPQRHIKAASILIDGLDLAGLYASLSTGTPYTARNGSRDIRVDKLSVDGTTPLMHVATLRSHATRTDAQEKEVSSLDGLELWPDVPNLSILPSLGYDHFQGNLLLSDTHDFKANIFHVDDFRLDGKDMGRLNLEGDFGQTETTALLSANAADMPVRSMTITYKDGGLVPRALKASADARGIKPEELVAQLQAQFGPQGPTPSPVLASFSSYLSRTGKGPLTITVKPQQPVPLLAIIASAGMVATNPQVARQIGLSVKVP